MGPQPTPFEGRERQRRKISLSEGRSRESRRVSRRAPATAQWSAHTGALTSRNTGQGEHCTSRAERRGEKAKLRPIRIVSAVPVRPPRARDRSLAPCSLPCLPPMRGHKKDVVPSHPCTNAACSNTQYDLPEMLPTAAASSTTSRADRVAEAFPPMPL